MRLLLSASSTLNQAADTAAQSTGGQRSSVDSATIGPVDRDGGMLTCEMYSEAEAARLLRVSQGTLHYWLEGKVYRRVTYDPILRTEATGKRTLTWAEFIEAGMLRQYRRDWKVPMAELRQFIVILRDQLGGPYPLATKRPWPVEQRLVIAA